MWIFLFRRLIALPPLLLVITLLTYLLLQLSPGDYFAKLEEDPSKSQDTVMEMRAAAGKVIEVRAGDRIDDIGRFTLTRTEAAVGDEPPLVEQRVYEFDASGALFVDGKRIDPAKHQQWLKEFTWPVTDGRQYTVTEAGKVYRWIGPVRGYFAWLGRVLRGDLGQSYQYNRSVADVMVDAVSNTLTLSIAALLIAWGLAIPLGVWSGVKPNSLVDHACGAVAYFGLSLPSVFLALLAILFAYHSGLFPVGGVRDVIAWEGMSFGEKALNRAHHLALPAFVVGFTSLAGYMRQMRGQMVETMSQDYIRTARAKGVSERRVTFRHALRNAINPLVTLLGFSLSALLSGSFLVEVVMNWPGLARVVVNSIFSKDEPLVLASVLMAAVMLVIGNLVADLLLAWVDPRIRVQ